MVWEQLILPEKCPWGLLQGRSRNAVPQPWGKPHPLRCIDLDAAAQVFRIDAGLAQGFLLPLLEARHINALQLVD
jgi:hypothetical protein